jgi:septal ring-binding cell division protein DamX
VGSDAETAAGTMAAPQSPTVVQATQREAARPRYTLHLLSSRSKADLKRVAQAHGLSHAVSYYQVEQQDGPHYRLILGGFDTVAEAQSALNALPAALFKSKPWVNNYPTQALVIHFEDPLSHMARR